MLKSDENRLTMLEAVCSFLDENEAVFAGISEFAEHRNTLKDLKDQI